jgi:hypothetical protein
LRTGSKYLENTFTFFSSCSIDLLSLTPLDNVKMNKLIFTVTLTILMS